MKCAAKVPVMGQEERCTLMRGHDVMHRSGTWRWDDAGNCWGTVNIYPKPEAK
jgi:hypothetical protein